MTFLINQVRSLISQSMEAEAEFMALCAAAPKAKLLKMILVDFDCIILIHPTTIKMMMFRSTYELLTLQKTTIDFYIRRPNSSVTTVIYSFLILPNERCNDIRMPYKQNALVRLPGIFQSPSNIKY